MHSTNPRELRVYFPETYQLTEMPPGEILQSVGFYEYFRYPWLGGLANEETALYTDSWLIRTN